MADVLSSPYLPYVIMLVNGIIAGWLASLVLGGGGILRHAIVGIIGAFLGGALVKLDLLKLPFDFGIWGNQIAVSTIGALIVIVIARVIAR
ncbi:MAG: GlsB/YeaQ/YmgE family stress response membrane protein [Hyphomicrobiaceae bacterium]|nr:GlsB/YeaQ/YmgE family stress response membrane protein [Hyphomicrobiaceae bacterium]